jgi:hypothetical protein
MPRNNIQIRIYSVKTKDSNVLTNVRSTYLLTIRMMVTGEGIPDATYITELTEYTVTLSNPLTLSSDQSLSICIK